MTRFRKSDRKAAGLAALWVLGAGVAAGGWANSRAEDRGLLSEQQDQPDSDQPVEVLGTTTSVAPTTTELVTTTSLATTSLATTELVTTTTIELVTTTSVAPTTTEPTTTTVADSGTTTSTESVEQTALQAVLADRPIEFLFSTAIPTPATELLLVDLASLMHEQPELRLHIVGHTDPSGNPVANQALSEARAQSVANHMILRGIDGARMTVEGRGSSDPIADNATQVGKEQNRRVVIESVDSP